MGNYDYPVSETVKSLFKDPSVNDSMQMEVHMSRRSGSRGRRGDQNYAVINGRKVQLSNDGFKPIQDKNPQMRVRLIVEEGEEIILSLDMMCLKGDLQALSQIILGKLK